MTIDLNEYLTLEQSDVSWNLVKTTKGVSKKGEPIERRDITYHATPWQAVQYAMSKHSYTGDLLTQMQELLAQFEKSFQFAKNTQHED